MDADRNQRLYEIFGSDYEDYSESSATHHENANSRSNDEDEDSPLEDVDDEHVNIFDEDEFTEVDDGDEHVPDEDEAEMVLNGPKVNMEFKSRSVVFNAFQSFAKNKSFAVAYRNSRPTYVMICCSKCRKSGKNKKRTKRNDCPVRLNAKKVSGLWKVTKVESNHNHDVNPAMSSFMSAHKSLSIHMKRQVDRNDISGLKICKTMRLFEVEAGGPQNVGASGRDLQNYIDKRRRLRLGEGDAEAIRQLFMRLQQKDRNFFYTMDIDDFGRLRNVLWIHPRSKAAYQGDFGDVISFDTTNLVNTYDMPFGSVVGVNHHRKFKNVSNEFKNVSFVMNSKT